MANDINKNKIQQAIKDFAENNLTKSAINLFQTLGYNTDRQAPLTQKNFNEFKDDYVDQEKNFNEDKALCNEWIYVDLLFQLSKEEILKQSSLFDTKQVDNTVIETYLFFSIELNNKSYTRTALSNITREVNKLFPMPVMILFKHGNTLTLSVINRRLHKRDVTKDVLEKVTQIKDINIEKPHRAHTEILFDLSFYELQRKYSFTNFVELHNAWQKTLDIQELNKRFFNELANWYFWATTQVAFPDDEIKEKDTRNATGVIRLITRLMFVWFLKEKNLVPDELFDQRKLKSILKFSDKKKSTFYKAILQNLFFATLNTEMGKRKFRSKQEQARDGHYFIHNVFRYEDEFIKPNKTLEAYFDPIPFLNGGLFECLDKQIEEKGKRKSIRIDGFSDRDDNVLKVDDDLFFGEEKTVDLTAFYDPKSKRKQHYKVRGLIHILDSYKFTITENTPIDEEIALDPELLGKVFENLLANYNPETKTTARKQTGSFYTPREIVNYMVDESLIAYLKQQLDEENDTEEKLRDLLSYSEKEPDFSNDQKDKLIKAIDDIKILDPACGSGAFPMGVLHKLVHILHKIDPKNKKWQQRQLNKVNKLIAEAEEITDTKTKNNVIADLQKNREGIIEAFENNELDYGRKLFLIENCIYGVDIQPIATQISKLRFFISLIVDQRTDEKKKNLGIRPLPNLETKFVAANTLIELEKENANLFTNPEIDKKKVELKKVRHKYFEARTPKTKEKCRQDDKRLRNELADILTKDHYLQPEAAKKLAAWDPYDQNASAPFFDSEWMFGLNKGFDLVIGNPPYVSNKDIPKNDKIYYRKIYRVAVSQYDLYNLFIEKSISLLCNKGVHSFIIPDSFLGRSSFESSRLYLIDSIFLNSILHFNKVFEGTTVSSIVYVTNKRSVANSFVKFTRSDSLEGWLKDKSSIVFFKQDSIRDNIDSKILHLNEIEIELVNKILDTSFNFDSVCTLWRGEEIGKSSSLIVETPGKDKLRIISGSNIKRYSISENGKYISKNNIEKSIKLYKKPKICVRQLGSQINAAIDFEGYVSVQSVYNIVPVDFSIYYLAALLNSSTIDFLYKSVFREKLEFPRILIENIRLLPIPKIDTVTSEIVESIVSYLHMPISSANTTYSFFERLLNAIVYEIFFKDSFQKSNCEVIKYLSDIPLSTNNLRDSEKLLAFEDFHSEFSNQKNPINMAMFKIDTLEEIRIIEGKQ